MTVTSTSARRTHEGNASATAFSFDFPITAPADLMVTLTDAEGTATTLVEGADYAVSVAAYPGSGSISYPLSGAPLPAGARLTLQRVLTIDQQIDLQNQGNFYAETHEAFFDKVVMICQQLADGIGRAAKLPVASSLGSLFFPQPSVGRAIVWNTAGDGLANGPSADEIAAAQGHAAIAASARSTAEAARDRAELWADAVEDAPVEPGRFSARHWAAKAAASAGSIALPSLQGGDAGRMLRVRGDVAGYELRTPAEVRTDIGAAPAGGVATRSAGFAVTAADAGKTFLVDAADGAATVALPAAAMAGVGFAVTIKKIDPGNAPVTVEAVPGETIDGRASAALRAQYRGLSLLSDGTEWFVRSVGPQPIVPLGAAEIPPGSSAYDIEWTNDDYATVRIVVSGLEPSADNVSLRAQLKVGGSYQTGTVYKYAGKRVDSQGNLLAFGSTQTSIDLSSGGVGTISPSMTGTDIEIGDPNTLNIAAILYRTIYRGPPAGKLYSVYSGGICAVSGGVTGVRLYFNGASILAGRISVTGTRQA